MDAPRFTTRFTATAHVYTPPVATAEGEALASLDQLKELLPLEITPETDTDLLYIVGNLAVGGVMNANDDAVTSEDMLSIYTRFERRQCNIEHNRGQIVGYILKAGLSEMGTNKLITPDEARASNKPFNLTTIAVLWKVANKDLCSFIIGSSAPGSPDTDALSLSFEVGFNDYSICLLPKGITDLSQATKVIPSDSPEFDEYDSILRVNKGSGKLGKDGATRVGRILGGDLVPLGQGVVTVPAAAVKGVAPILNAPENEDSNAEMASVKLAPDLVYTLSHMTLTTANRVKVPVGLAAKMKDDKGLIYPKATVTLSDGRVLKDVTVFNGEELELDQSISLEGVVITDMNPQYPPQIDDSPVVHPKIDDVYPTVTLEKQAENQKAADEKHILQNLPYTDALLKYLETAARILRIITDDSSVSPITTIANYSIPLSSHPMDLKDLKTLEAKIKTSQNPAEIVEAFASATMFAEEIMKASVEYSKNATESAAAKVAAEAALASMQTQLAETQATLTQIQAAQATAAAEAKFQERMASVAEAFDLDDEVRAYVVEEVKACSDDVSFEKYLTKAKKTMKGHAKKKAAPAKDDKDKADKGKKGKDDKDEDDDDKDAKAAAVAIASAVANPVDATTLDQIGDIAAAGAQTIKDKMAAAFGGENTSIGGRKIKDIVASVKK